MPAFQMTVDDRMRALYPGETDQQIQDRLDEMVGWVGHYASCTMRPEFNTSSPQAALIRNLVYRAMKYEKATDDGVTLTRTAGPFSRTVDNRRPTSPTPFAPDQQAVLRQMCASDATLPSMISVPLGLSDPLQYGVAVPVPVPVPAPGPTVPGGALVHSEPVAKTAWSIVHSFGRVPSVVVYNAQGEQVTADVIATDTLVVVQFANPTAGTAVLN